MQLLETERLFLRAATIGELDLIYHILVHELEGVSFTREDFDTELQFDFRFAQQPLGQQFGRPGIYLKGTNRYIGYCSLMPRLCTPAELSLYEAPLTAQSLHNSIEAEIGWAVSDQYRNQGYATEAARALIAYAFGGLHVPRIVTFTECSNVASIRVMEKLTMHIGQHPQTGAVVGIIANSVT